MSLLWGYFTFNERLTVWYGNGTAEVNTFLVTQTGSYSPLFWTMVVCQLRHAGHHARHPQAAHDYRRCVIASIWRRASACGSSAS